MVGLHELVPALGVLVQLQAVLEGRHLVLLRALGRQALPAAFRREHRVRVQPANVRLGRCFSFQLHDSAVLFGHLSIP